MAGRKLLPQRHLVGVRVRVRASAGVRVRKLLPQTHGSSSPLRSGSIGW